MRRCETCGSEAKGKWRFCTECKKALRKEMTESGYLERTPAPTTLSSSFILSKEHKGRKCLDSRKWANCPDGMITEDN